MTLVNTARFLVAKKLAQNLLHTKSVMSADWKKKLAARANHKKLREFYPVSGLVDGWYFRIHEDSPGCSLVEGRDIYGRMISWRTTGDPNGTLAECIEYARSVTGG